MIKSLSSEQLVSHLPKRYKEFTFISDSLLKLTPRASQQLLINPHSYFLDRAEIGDFLTIEQICTPENVISQLHNLQFRTNSIAELVSKTDKGSVIVKLNQTLIGLGREIVQRIVVNSEGKK
ncbi:MAG: FeoA family protein [Cyanobacteria bacterium J06643_13]